MKINYFIGYVLITLLFFNTFQISAQNIRGGVILGFNAAQVDGDNYGGYNKAGLNAGLMAELPISEYNLLLRMDLLFDQKGAASSFLNGQNNSSSVVNAYSVNLNYVEIPITLDYLYKKKYGLGIGLSLGKLIGGSETDNGLNYPITIGSAYDSYGQPTGNYEPWDINFIVDGLYLINGDHWMVNIRYMYSMRYIAKNNTSHFYNYGEFNNVLSLRLIYVLGNPPAK